MKQQQLAEKKRNYPALAFLMVCGGLLLLRLFCAAGFEGKYSMLYSDCYHQYYPFFVAFRDALRSGDSLLYNWSVGMGMDYLGLVSYYLASPLNLLSVLVPESLLLGYFSLLMPVKLGLAALFFSLFLKKLFDRDDFSISLFGCFYALCAWALGYQWNIMWLDTFALLPLVALGTIYLLRDKKFLLYTVTLFLSIFSNYYIGFFVCIFVALIFICYEICRWKGFVRFIQDLTRIAVFSILAIGMTAILTLPAFAALQSTQSSVNKFPTEFRLNIADEHTWFGLLDAMRQVAGNMNGGLEPTFKEGLPNIYCGIITNALAFLYLTCKEVKLRDKICAVVMLLFLNASFVIRQLDYIWHGFHFTNMIPYRFSFLYSFVLLYMAYHAWTLRKSFEGWQIGFAGLFSAGLMLCSNKLEDFTDLLENKVALQPWNTWANIENNLEIIADHSNLITFNVLFLIAYLAILAYSGAPKPLHKKATVRQKLAHQEAYEKRQKLGTTLLSGFMIAELVLNLMSFGSYFPGTNVVNYPKGTNDAALAIRYMHEREEDTLFYRAEVTHSQSLNDGALNGYNGITTFTSSANVNVTKFMQSLGYAAKDTYNRYCFEESSPVANLFLGLKYMIERDGYVEENPYFDDLHYFGKVHLLENNAYLPLGFLTNEEILDVDFQITDRFALQNELMRAASGIDQDVWHMLTSDDLSFDSSTVTVKPSITTPGYCTYTAGASSGKVVYTYTADRDGFMCISLNQSKRNNFSIYHNGTFLYNDSYSLPQTASVCQVKAGDKVEIKISCSAKDTGNITLTAAILDETLFRQAYDVLNASTLELTEFKNTYVEGTIQCDRDGVLYTSIPQNGNWVATIDGQPAQIELIGNAMIGIRVSEGTHTIAFTYRNKAFTAGWIVSLFSLLIFLTVYYFVYKPELKWLKKTWAKIKNQIRK